MEVQEALFKAVSELGEQLKASLTNAGKVASGKTIDSIEPTATDTSAQLLASPYIYALQDGRKPTSPNAATGDPTLFEQIKEWCAAKGIDAKAAYPITKHIHQYGYPGTPGIIDEPLSPENIDKSLSDALGDIANLFSDIITEQLNEKLHTEAA